MPEIPMKALYCHVCQSLGSCYGRSGGFDDIPCLLHGLEHEKTTTTVIFN